MKNSYLLAGLLLVVCFISINRVTAQNNLIFALKNGASKGILVANLDKITFASGSLIVKKTDTTTESFMLTDIQKMTFGIFSGINDVVSNQTNLAVYPNPASTTIRLINSPTDGDLNIAIFRIDGVQLINQQLHTATDMIDVSKLARGLYLLKVNNGIIKFTKQ